MQKDLQRQEESLSLWASLEDNTERPLRIKGYGTLQPELNENKSKEDWILGSTSRELLNSPMSNRFSPQSEPLSRHSQMNFRIKVKHLHISSQNKNKVTPLGGLFKSKYSKDRLQITLDKFRKAVNSIRTSRRYTLFTRMENELIKRIMTGSTTSRDFFTFKYIDPHSSFYMALRYIRAITVIINFVIIPVL
jgi:hypothetical protein